MSIVHLVSRPASGGIRTHLAGLLTDLPDAGWIPILHAPADLIDRLSSYLSDAQAEELDIAPSLSTTDLSNARSLARQLNHGAVVHAHGIRAAWICLIAARLVQFRLIVTLHNVPPKGLAPTAILKLIIKGSNRVICVSDYIARTVPSPKTVVIPNGVTLLPAAYGRSKAELFPDIAPDAFVVFSASRLSREKGIDILIDAARSLSDCQFVIAGDGPLKSDFLRSRPANVQLIGNRSDVADFMRAADCVALPSRTEGQGVAALEAFAAGTPVIASAVGGLPENVIDGKTGILINPEDVGALVHAIETLKSNPTLGAKLSGAGEEWVRANRQRQTQSHLVAQVYDDVLSKS